MSNDDPHDHLIKSVLGDPAQAAAWLSPVLGHELSSALHMDRLVVESGEFVSRALKKRHTDLLFSTTWRDGRPCLIYLLLEHQSTPDPMMAWRLMQYMVRIWERWLAKPGNASARKLPLVIPIVLYHGNKPWTARGLNALIDHPPELATSLWLTLPQLNYQVVDLLNIPDHQLPGRALTRMALILLRHFGLGHNLWQVLFDEGLQLRDAWQESGEAALESLLSYIYKVANEPDEKRVQAFVDDSLPTEIKEAFMYAKNTYAAKLFEQGHETGRLEGKLEGKREGKLEGKREGKLEGKREGKLEGRSEGILLGQRAFLRQLLERQFGELPPQVVTKLREADSDKLLAWSERLLSAKTLGEVFGEEGEAH